jgi:hypothetical protein
MRPFSSFGRKVRERYDEQRRMGEITPLSVAVCAGIVLYALYKSYAGQ